MAKLGKLRISLTAKLLMMFLTVLLVAIVIFGEIAYKTASTGMQQGVYNQINGVSSTVVNQIVAIKKFISALFDDSKGEIKLKSNITPCEIRTYPITGNVSYSAMAFSTKKCSSAYDVFSTVIQNTKLWQKIRIEGGAYGARCDYGYFSGLFVLSSYRDPRFKESFDDFISALDIDVTSQMLKKSKDSFFVDLANEPTNEKKAFYSIRNYLINLTNDMRKERFEKALSLTLAQAKAEMKALIEYSKTNSKASITPFGQI